MSEILTMTFLDSPCWLQPRAGVKGPCLALLSKQLNMHVVCAMISAAEKVRGGQSFKTKDNRHGDLRRSGGEDYELAMG